MHYRVLDAVDPSDAVFLELEGEAARPYTQFVYANEEQMQRIRALLLEKGVSEFAPPFARVLRTEDSMVGMMACLAQRELLVVRLKAARVLQRSGIFATDQELERAVRDAGRALAKSRAGDYYLSRIAIVPAWRGRGLGRVLLQRFESEARERGCRRLLLEVEPRNLAAVHSYRCSGFQEIDHARVVDERRGRVLDYLHMAKDL